MNPDLPQKLEEIINKALEKDRNLRYQHASEIRSDLKRLKRDADSGHSRAVSDTAQPASTLMTSTQEKKSESASQLAVAEKSGRSLWKIVASIAAVVAALIVGGFYWRSYKTIKLTDKDTVVLADFTNTTGDPLFDETLRQGLSVELEQSPFLSLVSEEGIHQTLEMMGQPKARLTPEVAREVCQRTGSAAVLNGSIALVGTRYNLILKAVNCANGQLLGSQEAQANDKSHILDTLVKLASDMRRKLGESLNTVQKYSITLKEATTPSLEALQAYSLGKKATLAGNDADALALYQRAIQFDPNFAMAYNAMAYSYEQLGEVVMARESDGKAFELRGRVTEPEKLIIEGDFYNTVPGDIMKARRSYMLGEQIYPREVQFHNNLGVMLNALGEYDAALQEHLEVLRLAPYTSLAYRFITCRYYQGQELHGLSSLPRHVRR